MSIQDLSQLHAANINYEFKRAMATNQAAMGSNRVMKSMGIKGKSRLKGIVCAMHYEAEMLQAVVMVIAKQAGIEGQHLADLITDVGNQYEQESLERIMKESAATKGTEPAKKEELNADL